MSEQLENCPICNNNCVPIEGSDGWATKCGDCGLKTEKFKTRYQLVKYWNDRPAPENTGDFKEMLDMQRKIDKSIDKILWIATQGKDGIEQPPKIEG